MALCSACAAHRHPHDRRVADGTDAGCPNLADPGDEFSGCTCHVVLPPAAAHTCPTCGRVR